VSVLAIVLGVALTVTGWLIEVRFFHTRDTRRAIILMVCMIVCMLGATGLLTAGIVGLTS